LLIKRESSQLGGTKLDAFLPRNTRDWVLVGATFNNCVPNNTLVDVKELLQAVLKRVKPSEAERRRLEVVASTLLKRVNQTCTKLKVRARAMLVGSAARNTWLGTERDIDVFILFPEELPREELERQGLAVARAVAGAKGKERYAEHPYVTMRFGGFDIDLVPCYDIAKPSEVRSAVDRSPHHQRYVSKRLVPELADEVLLLKRFMTGVGVYGAELKVQGFSGYLCELLTLYHRSFEKLVRSACGWKPGVMIDLARSYPDPTEARRLFEGQPLIVIDPVDPNRNAAAAVSMQNFATFVRACQDFVREPGMPFFFPKPVRRLSAEEATNLLKRRGTVLYCITFKAPDVVPDVLFPQLRKTERALVARLVREGFGVLRSDVWSNRRSAIVIELSAAKLPRARTHVGPPLGVEMGDFVRKHAPSRKKLAGPFVDAAGRLAFELEREHADARRVLELALVQREVFGRHVAEALVRGYEIHAGRGVTKLLRDRGLAEFISEYLTRCLPWYR